MTPHSVQIKINNTSLTIETGKVAKQADGSVVVRCGGTVVLSTAVASRTAMEGRDFLPLTVEYRERAYAGGRIPGGFFKREGRPDEEQMLEALAFGHERCKELTRIQKDLVARAAKPRWAFEPAGVDPALQARVKELASAKVGQALSVHEKQARAKTLEAIFEEIFSAVGGDETQRAKVREAFEKVEKSEVRRLVVEKGKRVDGPSGKGGRPLLGGGEDLPRAHSSALFAPGAAHAPV